MKSFQTFLTEIDSKYDHILNTLENLPRGKFFDDTVDITSLFKKSKLSHNKCLVDYEKNESSAKVVDVQMSKIQITQPYVRKNKILNLLKTKIINPIQAVKYGNVVVVIDGHHRLVAEYLIGKNKISVKLVEGDK